MDERFIKGGPMPVPLGLRADLYAAVRDLRLAMQKATDAVKDRETEISNSIRSDLLDSPDTGAAGQTTRVQLVMKSHLQVADWSALWEYIRQNDAFELLQKRLSEPAAVELVAESGGPVPGVAAVDVATLSFTKI